MLALNDWHVMRVLASTCQTSCNLMCPLSQSLPAVHMSVAMPTTSLAHNVVQWLQGASPREPGHPVHLVCSWQRGRCLQLRPLR